jgi:hypothetical protein
LQRDLIELVQNEDSATLQRDAIQNRQSQRKRFGRVRPFSRGAAPMSPDHPDGEAEQAELKRASLIERRSASNQTKEDLVRQILRLFWACAEAPQRREQVIELSVERLDEAFHGQRVLS